MSERISDLYSPDQSQITPTDFDDAYLLSSANSAKPDLITRQEVLNAQMQWASGIVAISKVYLDKGDYLCVDDPSRRRSLANNGVPRSGGMHVDEDDFPALLCLRVDNWKETEDITLLQRGLKNKFGIDSYPSIISLDGVVASTTTPLTNFLLIEDHHTDKFVNLINPHLPSRIQQSLRRVAGDKISLDRIRYEISSQQLLKGLRRSSMVGKSMQSHE